MRGQNRRNQDKGVFGTASQLPSGRWRARVRHPKTGKQVTAHQVIGGPHTYPTRRDAARAEVQRLVNEARQSVTAG